jgi:hypothetical protein
MKRPLFKVLLAVAVPAALLAADEAWKSKPYQQWDQKDVQKVLTDSPWSRVVRMEAKWRAAGGNGVPVDRDASSPGNYGAQGGTSANSGNVGGNSSYGMGAGAPSSANSGSIAQNSSIMNSGKTPETTFMIRWFSALTVREALARAQVLSGSMTESDAGKALADQPAEYTITVAGQDMTPFLKAEEKDLAGTAYLIAKKQNAKIPASHVVIQRTSNAKPDDPRSVAVVVFYFAKKNAAGEPVFGGPEKSAEFVCVSGGVTIKTSFDLAKMSGPSGPDW